MLRHFLLIAASAIVMLTGIPPALGQGMPSPDEMSAQAGRMVERIDDIRDQLQLSDEQAAQVREILQGNVERMRDVMQQHGVEPGADMSFRQKRKLAKDLRPIRKESDEKLQAILSPEQFDQFQVIRKQAREDMKARRQGA